MSFELLELANRKLRAQSHYVFCGDRFYMDRRADRIRAWIIAKRMRNITRFWSS